MALERVAHDGAWGLRFPTLTAASAVMVDAPDWPTVDLEVEFGVPDDGDDSSEWDAEGMHVRLLAGGRLEISWPDRVRLLLRDHPIPECVVQPHLTTAAASIALHTGRQAFHAGAFNVGGRTWGVLGAKEAGKSSTLALVAARGAAVVTDDLLVVERGSALAGPRCIDLRPEAAAVLGIGEALGTVGLRERWRVRVDPCPLATPVVGWVVPAWGDAPLTPVAPVDRLRILLAHCALQGITMNDPDEYLRLASLPMLSWSRRRDWTAAGPSVDELLGRLATVGHIG
jgi:hypothetical protein